MKIRNGSIYLTDTELSKTRGVRATELSCGCNVHPRLKKVTYMKHVHCPVHRKTVMVIADCVYERPEELLADIRKGKYQ